jgi:hypothetical protein
VAFIRQAAAPLSQSADSRPIRTYQRLFFGAPPALNLPFNGNPVRDLLEAFGPDENNRTSRKRVARMCSGIVLSMRGARSSPVALPT